MKYIIPFLLLARGALGGYSNSKNEGSFARYVPELSGKVTILASRGRDFGMDFDIIWKAKADNADALLTGLKDYNPRSNELGLISKNYPGWWP